MKQPAPREAGQIGIFGGGFNPIHAGHVRLVLEVMEALHFQRIDLVPCASPPHKSDSAFLPFALRAELVEAALRGLPDFAVNMLEGQRNGPSYTLHTVQAYREQSANIPAIILGAENFMALPHWKMGLELPLLADFVIVPRAEHELNEVRDTLYQYWPQAQSCPAPQGMLECWQITPETRCLFAPLPRLDISSTMIRKKWRQKKSIRYLVPDPVLEILNAHTALVDACWNKE